jgi:hypothetical protein
MDRIRLPKGSEGCPNIKHCANRSSYTWMVKAHVTRRFSTRGTSNLDYVFQKVAISQQTQTAHPTFNTKMFSFSLVYHQKNWRSYTKI